MDTVRVSLDLTLGTFTQVEALCKSEFRNKADYLRMIIKDDLAIRRISVEDNSSNRRVNKETRHEKQ